MRGKVLKAIVTLSFVFLAAGLFYTQVVRYSYYMRLSKNNSIRLLPIEGPRGMIFDRNGKPIVTNRLSFDVALVYEELRDRARLSKVLKETLGLSKRQIIEALLKSGAKPYVPVTIAEDIGNAKALVLEENTIDTPGLMVQVRSKRGYPYKTSASHIVGYLSEITETELESLKDYGYRPRDLLGRDGLEKYYETYLKGKDGGTQVEVDSRGRHIRVLGIKEPAAGQDLHLSIDIDLQLECDKLLGERQGAIIAINPKNGEVLALASTPGYDPNIFIEPDYSGERVSLMSDRSKRPMLNRSISGQYPPGSVFKIVTAAAALENKAIDKNTSFFCEGSFDTGRASLDCWKAEGHGYQNILDGIMNSCNVFFCNIGKRAGPDAIESYAKAFGFGRVTGLDLPGEAKGLVPGKAWKRLFKKDDWYEGDTLNYSIGQRYLLATP
nr:penicillin-binding protein 2 [Candidatus Omnitrophota bacterium]